MKKQITKEGKMFIQLIENLISKHEFGTSKMTNTFGGCTMLTGEIEIHANPTSYDCCFSVTQQPITLTGSSTMLVELAATGNNGNVTVQFSE